ncbi:hypothetical protein ABZ816_36760 [Actinosynnema sp. NPDC047251]|uniref:Uncharacterized protein n=1 Tax=Saccharothrix espanaensis (strain ATCC 51144 / DSM 44229 / JCM 9112 / NBRC 15066 / NRRL 15764) TaxID=1179773 RepID=K0JR70_SACES|nr:hypothetical protein [Saccharothrix espanaensis]CCH28266.1 hypothetical protein BN6_09360 [Saccharothrix espanaensis DSM 44229]
MQPLLHHAASALGWRGIVVPDVAVLGHQVSAVVRVRADVHEWRSANGWPPQADPSWFRSWFEPTAHDQLPVPAVELVGVLVGESTVDRALQSCGTLMTLAPCSVVLPAPQGERSWPLMELDYYGIGVVAVDEAGTAELLVPPEDRSTEFGPSLFGRWLLEVLYDRVLKEVPANARVNS